VDSNPLKKHCIYLSQPLGRGMHASTLFINSQSKTISYQDPYNTKADNEMKRAIAANFPGYRFEDSCVTQQHDMSSCAVITVDNLVRLAQGEAIKLNPDVKALRKQHEIFLPSATFTIPATAATGENRSKFQINENDSLA
jgi:hypothetical protein